MSLMNRKIVVTGGPTREWIDPVRYISNASSGKMGAALADVAAGLSRDTVFIHGPMDALLLQGKPYRMVNVETTADLLNAVIGEIVPGTVLVMSAAPADYAPVEKSPIKLKKAADDLCIKLKMNPDILKTVAGRRAGDPSLRDIFVVGFAAETDNIEAYALSKLKEKDLDMICLNDVSRAGAGFSGDTNIVTIFTRGLEKEELPLLSKHDVAVKIFERIELELTKRGI